MNHGELDGKAALPARPSTAASVSPSTSTAPDGPSTSPAKRPRLANCTPPTSTSRTPSRMRASPASSERARRQTTRGPTRTTARTTPHSTPPVALERPIRDERRDDSRPSGALHRRRTFISMHNSNRVRRKTIPRPARVHPAKRPRNVRAFLPPLSRLQFRPRVSYHVALVRRFRWTAFVPAGASPFRPVRRSLGASGCLLRCVVPRVHPPIVVRAPLIHLRRLGRLRELQPTVSRAVRVRVRLETPADVRRTPHPRVTR